MAVPRPVLPRPALPRSTIARSTARAPGSRSSATQTTISRAPHSAAATSAPSSTRWGDHASSVRSLALAGSPSMALTTISGRRPLLVTASHLAAAGNPPPPLPVRPAAATSAQTAWLQLRSSLRGSVNGPCTATWASRLGAAGASAPVRSRRSTRSIVAVVIGGSSPGVGWRWQQHVQSERRMPRVWRRMPDVQSMHSDGPLPQLVAQSLPRRGFAAAQHGW